MESPAIDKGTLDHRRVDARSDERITQRKGVDLEHHDLGIVGRCDVIEEAAEGLRIIEFKAAPGRRSAVVTRAQTMQLALQGMCLEAMGHRLAGYAVHFTTARKTVEVEISDDDRERAMDYVRLTREVVESDVAPPPLMGDRRCESCSHVSVCLPDEFVSEPKQTRRIAVANPDGQTLHLTVPGSRASIKEGRLLIKNQGEQLASLPIERVDAVVVHGNVDLSSGLVRELLWRRVPIVWASYRGQVIGYARSAKSPNGLARSRVSELSDSERLLVARELVASKITNQATQLRRSARQDVEDAVKRMRHLARVADAAPSTRYLFGIEGESAALYFGNLTAMLGDQSREEWLGLWEGRIGRRAEDPINVALNVVYGALLADVVRAVISCGLDPHLGFLHSSKRNKPALALDLMEQFRPIVADSVVLGAINNRELRRNMFIDVMGSHRLTDPGRRVLMAAYERRVQTTFKHPVFGYEVTYRRAIEVQARFILGVIDGTQPRYRGIRNR